MVHCEILSHSPTLESELQKAFFDYINYPHKTVEREELYKLREHGGAKLVHVQAKSEASKVQWLIDLCINPTLSGHLGYQKGKPHGSDLFFTSKHYAKRILRTTFPFYQEAIRAITTLDVCKRILDLRADKLFKNPVFTRPGRPPYPPDLPLLRGRRGLYLRATPRRGGPTG